jgi:hypothetical protein
LAGGDVKVTLNTKSAKTTNWGGLVVAGQMPLSQFAREYANNDTMRTWQGLAGSSDFSWHFELIVPEIM